MDEKALNYSYELFKSDGYTGSLEQYQDLLATNEDALNVAHNLFTRDGYNGGLDTFSNLIGLGDLKKKANKAPGVEVEQVEIPVEETMVAASPSQDGISDSTEIEEPLGVVGPAGSVTPPQGVFGATGATDTIRPTDELVQVEESAPKYDFSYIRPELIDMEEEEVVPILNEEYGGLGFEFSQTGAGDAVRVTKNKGTDKEVEEVFDLDPFLTSTEKEQSNALKKWLNDNTTEEDVRNLKRDQQSLEVDMSETERVSNVEEDAPIYLPEVQVDPNTLASPYGGQTADDYYDQLGKDFSEILPEKAKRKEARRKELEVTDFEKGKLALGKEEGNVIAAITGDMMGAVEPGMEMYAAETAKEQIKEKKERSNKEEFKQGEENHWANVALNRLELDNPNKAQRIREKIQDDPMFFKTTGSQRTQSSELVRDGLNIALKTYSEEYQNLSDKNSDLVKEQKRLESDLELFGSKIEGTTFKGTEQEFTDYKSTAGELSALYTSPEFKEINQAFKNMQSTVLDYEDNPDVKILDASKEILDMWQRGVDRAYKDQGFIGDMFQPIFHGAAKSSTNLVSSLAALANNIVPDNKYDRGDIIDDYLSEFSNYVDATLPTPSKFGREFYEKSADINGFDVILDGKGNPTGKVYGPDGYLTNSENTEAALGLFNDTPNLYEKKTNYNKRAALYSGTEVSLDMLLQLMPVAGVVSKAGKAAKLGAKLSANLGVAAGIIVQSQDEFYEKARELGATDQEALAFGLAQSGAIAAIALINPVEAKALMAMTSGAKKNLASSYVKSLLKGASTADAVNLAVKATMKEAKGSGIKTVLKEGVKEGLEEITEIPGGELVSGAWNYLGGINATRDVEMSEVINTFVLAGVGSLPFAFIGGKGKGSVANEMLYSATNNLEETKKLLEENKGKVVQTGAGFSFRVDDEYIKEHVSQLEQLKKSVDTYSTTNPDITESDKMGLTSVLARRKSLEEAMKGADPVLKQEISEALKSIDKQLGAYVTKKKEDPFYILDGEAVSKEQLDEKMSDPEWVDGLKSGRWSLTIQNDPVIEQKLSDLYEGKEKTFDPNAEEVTVEPTEEPTEEPQEKIEDDKEVTEQEPVDTEEQGREEDPGQVQEPEVSEKEGATDPILQTQEEVETDDSVDKKIDELNKSDVKNKSIKRTALRDVKRAIKSLSKIAPNVKFKVHTTQESFAGSNPTLFAKFKKNQRLDKGYFDTATNTIHINLDRQDNFTDRRTVMHEVFHAVLFNSLGKTDVSNETKVMVDAVMRSANITQEVKDELNNFSENYEDNLKNEEKMSELFGLIAGEYQKLSIGAKNKVKNFINKVAKALNISEVFEGVTESAEVVDLLNTLAQRFQEGEVITEKDVAGISKIEEGIKKKEEAKKKESAKKVEVKKKEKDKKKPTKKPTKKKPTRAERRKVQRLFDSLGDKIKSSQIKAKLEEAMQKMDKEELKSMISDLYESIPKENLRKIEKAAKKAGKSVVDFLYGVASKTIDYGKEVADAVKTLQNNLIKLVATGLIVNSAFNAEFKSPVSMGDLSAWTETLSDNGFNSATMELSINNENVAKAFLNLYNADILDESSQNKLERLLFTTGQKVDNSVQEIDVREEEKIDYKKIEEEKAKEEYLNSQTYVENIPNTDKRIASFRVQTPASKGREYIAIPNQRNRDKSGKNKVEGVQFIAQFLLDINATTQTEDRNPGFHENSRSFDGFVPVVTNQYGDRVVVTYKRYSELDLGLDEGNIIASLTGDMMGAVEPGMEEDVAKRSKKQRIKQEKKSTKDRILSPLRQFKFSDIDWDGEGTSTMKSAKELTLNKGVGKSPYRKESGNEYNGRDISNNGVDLIYTPGKKSEGLGKDSYGKFVGGSVTYIFEDKAGNRFFRDVAGPVNQIRQEGESIAKTYGIDPSTITIGIHDVGSFSRKIRANSKGEIPYQEISDLNGEPDTGSALGIPTEPTIKLRKDVEMSTPEEFFDTEVSKKALTSIRTAVRNKSKVNDVSVAIDVLDAIAKGEEVPFEYDELLDKLTYGDVANLMVADDLFENNRKALDYLLTIGDKAVAMKDALKFRKDVKAPTYRSTAEEGLSKLPNNPMTPDAWVKQIVKKGGKGTQEELFSIDVLDRKVVGKNKNNEDIYEYFPSKNFKDAIGWIGDKKVDLKDQKAVDGKYLKSVPKEVVEKYIKDSQIEIVDITKDDKGPNSEELQEKTQRINERLDGVTNRLDDLLDRRGDALDKIKELKEPLPGKKARAKTVETTRAISDLRKEIEAIEEQITFTEQEQDMLVQERINVNKSIDPKSLTRHGELTLKGGKKYREVLMTLPPETQAPKYLVDKINKAIEDGDAEVERRARRDLDSWTRRNMGFKNERHFSEVNILAHIRMNERTLLNGEKVLFLEEIQSDWAQAGRDRGFSGNLATDEDVKSMMEEAFGKQGLNTLKLTPEMPSLIRGAINKEPGAADLEIDGGWKAEDVNRLNEIAKQRDLTGVPDMPYKKTDQWVGMAIRRAIKIAADEGIDRIAWVTGDQSADRYNLRKQISKIETFPNPINGEKMVTIYPKGKEESPTQISIDASGVIIEGTSTINEGDKLSEYVGKELASEIISKDDATFTGDDLEMGGQGMKNFYNTIVPKVAKQEAKRLDKDAKVDVIDLSPIADAEGLDLDFRERRAEGRKEDPGKQLSIAITPKMVEAVEPGVVKFRKDTDLKVVTEPTNFPIEQTFKDLGITAEQKKAWRDNKNSKKLKQDEKAQEIAKKISGREIDFEEARELMLEAMPTTIYTDLPSIPTFTELALAINSNKLEKGIVGFNSIIPDGTRIGIRLDIPAYTEYGIYAETYHLPGSNNQPGKPFGYGRIALLKDAQFLVPTNKALAVAAGTNKSPFAAIRGNYFNEDVEVLEEMAQKALESSINRYKNRPDSKIGKEDWIQVGMNPYKQSQFFDRKNGNPVKSANEVIQVGPLVLAKGAEYGDVGQFIDEKAMKKEETFPEYKSLLEKEKKGNLTEAQKNKLESLEQDYTVKFRKDVPTASDKMRDDAKKIKTTPTDRMIRKKVDNFVKNWFKFQEPLHRVLKNAGLNVVSGLKTNEKGVGGRTKQEVEKMTTPIYKGLNITEKQLLDDILIARRAVTINEERKRRVLQAKEDLENGVIKEPEYNAIMEKELVSKKYPDGKPILTNDFTEKDFREQLEELEARNPKMFEKVNARADKYFDVFSKLLDQDLKDGLITQGQYDAMKGIDYAPRVFMRYIYDINGTLTDSPNWENKLVSEYGLGKESIRKLKAGTSSEEFSILNEKLKNNKITQEEYDNSVAELNDLLFEIMTDSEVLISNYIAARNKRRVMNETNRRLSEELPKVFERISELNSKKKNTGKLSNKEQAELDALDRVKESFQIKPNRSKGIDVRLSYYDEGVRKSIYTTKEIYDMWYDNRNAALTEEAKANLATLTGARALKAMATGINPAFVLSNLPRDFVQVLMFTDTYTNTPGSKFLLPIRAMKLTKDFVVAAWKIGKAMTVGDKSFEEAVEDGMMLDFMHLEGRGKALPSTSVGAALEKAYEGKMKIQQSLEDASTKGMNSLGIEGSVSFKAKTLGKALRTMVLGANEVSEIGFRLAIRNRIIKEKMAELDKRKEKGEVTESEYEAESKDIRVLATAKSREYMDFSTGGTYSKQLETVLPYFNAAAVGSYASAKYIKKNPTQFFYDLLQVAGIGSAFPLVASSVALAMGRGADDEDEKKAFNNQAIQMFLAGKSENYISTRTGWKFDGKAKLDNLNQRKSTITQKQYDEEYNEIINNTSNWDHEGRPGAAVMIDQYKNIPSYIKDRAYITFTGKRGENGGYQYAIISKNQGAAPFLSVVNDIYINAISEYYLGEKVYTDGEIAANFSRNIFNNYNPFGVDPLSIYSKVSQADGDGGMILAQQTLKVFSRNPLFGGVMEIGLNWDMFRDRPIVRDNFTEYGRTSTEGYRDPNVQSFFFDISESTGISSAPNLKFGIEKLLTSPSTNPFMATVYGYGAATLKDNDKFRGSKQQSMLDHTVKQASKRLLRETSSYSYNEDKSSLLEESTDKYLDSRLNDISDVRTQLIPTLTRRAADEIYKDKSFMKSVFEDIPEAGQSTRKEQKKAREERRAIIQEKYDMYTSQLDEEIERRIASGLLNESSRLTDFDIAKVQTRIDRDLTLKAMRISKYADYNKYMDIMFVDVPDKSEGMAIMFAKKFKQPNGDMIPVSINGEANPEFKFRRLELEKINNAYTARVNKLSSIKSSNFNAKQFLIEYKKLYQDVQDRNNP